MDEQLNEAPCGFLTLSEEGIILSINQTLLKALEYESGKLNGQHIHSILTVPARLFYQLYLVPLIKLENQLEEIYISLRSFHGEEIPVLVNAVKRSREGKTVIECILIPMRRRSEYENELLIAKKEAESALVAKNKAHADLEAALKTLKTQKDQLIEMNEKNEKYKADTERELKLARKIQETSLTGPIVNEYIEIQSYYKASRELSGDIYGFYQIDRHRYGIILLDVMGHGISSALITMSLHSLFQRLISKGAAADTVMTELDHHLHTLFHNNSEAWHYCTAIYLLIDTRKQEINYINAGHPPAFLLDLDGQQYQLRSTTPPIGAFEGTLFKTNTITYRRGSRLLLYTDGVEEPLGSDHLCSLLQAYSSAPLSTLKGEITQALMNKEDTYRQKDDHCLILVDLK